MGLEAPKYRKPFQKPRRGWDNFSPSTCARGRVLGTPRVQTFSKQCGARTRKDTACRSRPIPGKARCRFHGGLSTGPKTQAGRNRIADAQRRRWAIRLGRQSVASGAFADLDRRCHSKALTDE
ncbi:HGGxSTG domain-containing protein [Leisingera sp. ANG59]|uniref:HGGxSTG domain-containing protein n=1 Tax=Leisingera sp. ANG59 TaxID=2675221 RepID=UPI0034A06200